MRNYFIILAVLLTGVVLHYLQWWEILGLFALKFILGIKVKGAKTLGAAIIKAGGKKAVLFTATSVMIKRHVIDLISKFFVEHSVGRYSISLKKIFQSKYEDIKGSKLSKKIQSGFFFLASLPILSYMWTNVLSSVMQKVFYKLFYPVILFVWTLISSSFGFISSFISFLFQLIIISVVRDNLEKSYIGRKVLKAADAVVYLFGNILNMMNKLFNMIGLDPKHFLISSSLKMNRWLEAVLDKGKNAREKVLIKRERRINKYEAIAIKRAEFKKKREKTVPFKKKMTDLVNKKILNKKDWREKRVEREKNLIENRVRTKIKKGYM